MFRIVNTAALALALSAGLAAGGTPPPLHRTLFAQDQAAGQMHSGHTSNTPKATDHMSSGAKKADHMAAGAGKIRIAPDAMSSGGVSNSQH